jgi:hypothetical protein
MNSLSEWTRDTVGSLYFFLPRGYQARFLDRVLGKRCPVCHMRGEHAPH